jgi:hypothetical protein
MRWVKVTQSENYFGPRFYVSVCVTNYVENKTKFPLNTTDINTLVE